MSHKTVWITGASSGIGREFACRYAKLGFRLILTARRRERLDQLAAELLAKYNTFCRVLPADLARESECTRLCEELAEERIDIFINNAGFGVCGSFLETSTEAELSIDRALEDGLRIKDAIAQVVQEHPLADGSLANRKQVYAAVLKIKG